MPVIEGRRQVIIEQDKNKVNLERKYGVEGHPKADLIFQLAWEYGHSSGWSEVETYYIDLVEIIQ